MQFQAIRKNDDPRYVPLVIVHDADSDGETMMSRMRSLAWQRLDFNALLVCPTFAGTYGFLGDDADRQLIDALTAQTSVPQITERVLVYGFGDGAQFAHRFTLKHPRRVAGCAALSAGSWTDPAGLLLGTDGQGRVLCRPPLRHRSSSACPQSEMHQPRITARRDVDDRLRQRRHPGPLRQCGPVQTRCGPGRRPRGLPGLARRDPGGSARLCL